MAIWIGSNELENANDIYMGDIPPTIYIGDFKTFPSTAPVVVTYDIINDYVAYIMRMLDKRIEAGET